MSFGEVDDGREAVAPDVDECVGSPADGSSKLWRIPALYCALLFGVYLLVIVLVFALASLEPLDLKKAEGRTMEDDR